MHAAVVQFHKPLAALVSFKPGIYNLALLDVKMDEINGFDLYKKLKEIDSNIKVCFLTASDSYIDDFRRLFPELDHMHFMLKPIENELLVTRVQQLNDMR